jgi:ectoine hydroxylase-related dioxygenase (phytanoyl-CoA dioxygenase family)
MKVEGHFDSINAFTWSDAFIVNFNHGAEETWQPPSGERGRWHQDGAFFRHFLNSREQALLTIVYWTDVAHQGGGTFIAPDSVRHIARFLADHPEGVPPSEIPFQEIIKQCSEFAEVTGEIGDFVILHPFMLHASSQNVLGTPRFMSNPPVVLKEQMNLNREDPADFSLLERATLHFLGLERLDFQPTALTNPIGR